MYKIIRHFLHKIDSTGFHKTSSRVIKRGLTLEEAKAHCSSEKTHKLGNPKKYKQYVNWFDGFEKE